MMYPFQILPGPPKQPLKGLGLIISSGLLLAIPFLIWLGWMIFGLVEYNFVYSAGVLIGLIILTYLLLPTAERLYRAGQGLRVSDTFELLEKDRRPLVLFLRSFEDDTLLDLHLRDSGSITFLQTQEMVLVKELRKVGPVVAIGRPGEQIPSLGAARFYVSDDQWRTAVTYFMHQAAIVVFMVGRTPGMLWEVRAALRICPLQKLLFYFPYPVHQEQRGVRWLFLSNLVYTKRRLQEMQTERQRRYDILRQCVYRYFALTLPGVLGQAAFLDFIADGQPRLLQYRKNLLIGDPREADPTQLNIKRTLRPFMDKIAGKPTRVSWLEKFLSRRANLAALILLITAGYALFIYNAWQTQSDALCFGVFLIPVLLLPVLYQIFINIRNIRKG